MRIKILILFLAVLIINGCNQNNNQATSKLINHNGSIKIIGAFALTPLMQLWINEFHKIHPEIKIELNSIGSGYGLDTVLNGKADLAMISSEISATSDSLLWSAPVCRLAVVPVINTKNPYLKDIMKKGIKRNDLADVFSDKNQKKWGDIYGKPGKDPIRVYYRNDESGASATVCKYLFIDTSEFIGIGMADENKMLAAVKNDPLSIGYCNFIYTFDPATKKFYNEFSILPIDINQNGKIDEKEDFYKDYDHLQRAMWLGKYPCELTRNLYLVAKEKPHSIEEVTFLLWILQEGQKFVTKEGYIQLLSSEVSSMVCSLQN